MNKLAQKLLLCIVAVLAFFTKGESQDGNPLQFLRTVSQSSTYNPAFQNRSEKLVIGLPLISGFYFDWNSNFSTDYFFYNGFDYSFARFYNALDEPGITTANISSPLIYLSLRSGRQNFSLSIRERVLAETQFDNKVLDFIDKGLASYYGNDESFGPINFKAFYYREFALTYATEIGDGLSIGIRPKLLTAHFYYDVVDFKFETKTDLENDTLQLIPSGSYKISGPVTVNYDPENSKTEILPNATSSDYLFGFRNLSPAVDIGIDFRNDKGFAIAASVSDLGFLKFKHDNYALEYYGAIQYNKKDLYQSNDPNSNDSIPRYLEPRLALQQLSDTIAYNISVGQQPQTITQHIPIKINLSARQALSKQTEGGLSGQISFYENNTQHYLTGFVHTTFQRGFEVAATLSVLNFNKILPGAGFSYTGRWAQYYLSANNITGLIKPASAKYLNLCFGVNFLFSTAEK